MNIPILSIPLFYIDKTRNVDYEQTFKEVGFEDITHFPAVQGSELDMKKMAQTGVLGCRAYNDLTYGRHQHTGVSTSGTIGCHLSHVSLWQKCVDLDLPYMIIAEADVIPRNLTDSEIEKISKVLRKPTGIVISSKNNYKKGSELLFGAHLYFITQEAAKALLKYAFPIHMQLDSYIGYIGNIDNAEVESLVLCDVIDHKSSTSDLGKCIKCFLPSNRKYYIYSISVISVILLVFLIIGVLRRV
jgi:GR25 family glycosyltransferase involved in LPS biosynthesis